jgi:signal transduction histidine kinase/ActR/RegA family two-component response regulator
MPVVAFLVLLPLVLGWIVTDALTHSQEETGHRDLATAQRLFQTSLDDRRHDLLLRFRPIPQTSAFTNPAQLAVESGNDYTTAINTLREALRNQLDSFRDECQIILFTGVTAGAEPIVVKQPEVEPGFALAAESVTDEAMREGEATGIVVLGNTAYYAIAVAIAPDLQPLGVLTFGVRLDISALERLQAITGSEIFLTGPHGVMVSTLRVDATPVAQADGTVVMNGIHYLPLAGAYDEGKAGRGFDYTLLWSVEPNLRMRSEMEDLVAEVSVAAVILSIAAIWYFTRRSMKPLLDLRDAAETVGRGDFSRRVRVYAHDESGDVARAFNAMTDNLQQSRAELEKTVETLKATQNQLIQSEKLSAVGQFVSGVAHELNNPLAAVIGFSELLAQTAADEKVRPHLDMIAKSAQRCHKIVQNLLSFARQHPPERKAISINTVVEEVLDFMAYEFKTSNIAIERQLAGDLPPIQGDPHQLQQVFVNILGNARQAIQGVRRDGRIVVRTRCPVPGKVAVELIDNGPGIRPEHLSRIFDPFFTTKPVGKGTGLGLSLTYGIIREHGGSIRAESVLGNGATFVIELPSAGPGVSRGETARPAATLGPPAAPSGKTVLVVDDEDWLLELSANLLRQDGHTPVVVHSGEEAIKILGQRRVDLILSDWKMPGLSGAAFFEHLEAVYPRAAERILFMTGDVMNDSLQEFLARRGKQCLAKPFPIEQFRAAVAAELSRTPAAAARS